MVVAAVCGVLVSLALPTSGWAQEPGSLEVAGGYSFLGDSELVDGFGLGWFAEGGWRTTRWLSLTAEVSRHRRTQDVGFIDIDVTFQTLLAGPRIWFPTTRFTPFVHLLAGATRLDVVARTSIPVAAAGDDAATYPTLQVGGGLEEQFAAQTGHFQASCRSVVTLLAVRSAGLGSYRRWGCLRRHPPHRIEGGERNR